MNNNVEKTLNFIKDEFSKSEYFNEHEEDREYRFRHTLRVANIGMEIAKKESFDVEELTIGCLLHDISYIKEFKTHEDWKGHGREASKIAREFLEELDIPKEKIEEICYGIAIHVDDEADFQGERTALALSIGDADNIDRFDVYRIYSNLQSINFSSMKHEEQLEVVNKKLEALNKYLELPFGTKTATELWKARLLYQIDFFSKLKQQLECGDELNVEEGGVICQVL